MSRIFILIISFALLSFFIYSLKSGLVMDLLIFIENFSKKIAQYIIYTALEQGK